MRWARGGEECPAGHSLAGAKGHRRRRRGEAVDGSSVSIDRTMDNLYIVRRTQIYIDEAQGERLADIAERSRTTMSGVIRDAIDSYLERESSSDARLTRFRAAVTAAAGSAPELPPGEEYVEAIRPDYAARAGELWGEE